MNNAFTKEVMPMLDLQNDKNFTLNNENNHELNNINHVTIVDDTVTENTTIENVLEENNESLNEAIFSGSNIVENIALNTTTNANLDTNNITNNTDTPEPNCLALTVRKDYNLVIVKNIFTASGRLSWKIVLATVVLNILNMLF